MSTTSEAALPPLGEGLEMPCVGGPVAGEMEKLRDGLLLFLPLLAQPSLKLTRTLFCFFHDRVHKFPLFKPI